MHYKATRYLLASFLVLIVPATPVLAHEHRSEFHHVVSRHHHNYEISAYRHRAAYRYRSGRTDVAADQQTPGIRFGGPFLFGAGTALQGQQPSFNYFSQSGGSVDQISAYQGMVAEQAGANGVPPSLVHRVIMRESRYNPRAVSRGNYGLMQIRLGTARAMGYGGSADGLLDPLTNMTYAVRYLAGAYRAAGGDENRAVALYARGYYQEAKAQGVTPYAAQAFVR
jgi:hypothetical protein